MKVTNLNPHVNVSLRTECQSQVKPKLQTCCDRCLASLEQLHRHHHHKWMLMAQTVLPEDMVGGRNVTKEDVCYMSNDYLDAILKKNNATGRPIALVVESGGSEQRVAARASEVRRAYRTAGYSGASPHPVLVEQQVLLRSRLFIGTPGDPHTATTAMIRDASAKQHDTNIRRRFPCM